MEKFSMLIPKRKRDQIILAQKVFCSVGYVIGILWKATAIHGTAEELANKARPANKQRHLIIRAAFNQLFNRLARLKCDRQKLGTWLHELAEVVSASKTEKEIVDKN